MKTRYNSKKAASKLAEKANKANKNKNLYKPVYIGVWSLELYNVTQRGWYIENTETNKIL